MNADPNIPEKSPTPQELAAYADGELSAVDTAATEAWLRQHPEAVVEVQTLRRLDRLWQEQTPIDPAPALWDKTLKGIESRLAAPKPTPKGLPRFRIALWIAAACVAAVFVARIYWPTPRPLPEANEEPYPVATADEIVIISMDPRNTLSLVVGQPPVDGDLVFADHDDVILLDAQPNEDGQVPDMHQGGNVPLILPTEAWGGKED